jgi:hypothetical protein
VEIAAYTFCFKIKFFEHTRYVNEVFDVYILLHICDEALQACREPRYTMHGAFRMV